MNHNLPKSMRALVVETTERPSVLKDVETPLPVPGSAIVEVEDVLVISYARDVYNGKRKYPFPTPIIGGSSAIARIAAVGPDSTRFKAGDLVYVDCVVRSRDDKSHIILAGATEGDTAGSKKLMHEVWRDWTFGQYARVPLENVFRLDEELLVGRYGYSFATLSFISYGLVPYGGLKDMNVQAGETVIIGPATGGFGGAGVLVALAMGAKVIAMGRNTESLAKLKARVNSPLLETVPITGNVEEELAALKKAARGEADTFLDIGPVGAYQSSHITSGILALRQEGRASLMAGYRQPVALPYRQIMHRNMSLQGKWMYEPKDVPAFIKLVETKRLDLDICKVTEYGITEWEKAFDQAADESAFAQVVAINPRK